jgi:hypothetical protein
LPVGVFAAIAAAVRQRPAILSLGKLIALM